MSNDNKEANISLSKSTEIKIQNDSKNEAHNESRESSKNNNKGLKYRAKSVRYKRKYK